MTQAPATPDPLAREAQRLRGLPWPGRPGEVTIQVNDRGLVITLVGSVLFATGSSDLLPQAEPVLVAVAQRVRDLPGALLVESVADDAPAGAAGLDLAARRGTAVARFLTSREGIPASRVAVIGRKAPAPASGESQRRVDIIVLRRVD